MHASTFIKAFGASAVALAAALAFAQGNPPTTGPSNPAQGAGQQSSQSTPMGTTGTQAQGAGSTGTTGATTGSTAASSSTTADTTMASSGSKRARADRN